ncbi:transcriptional regulator [Erythrobacter sp. NE805]|uniref:transcriptional regulator n=1 Tax=Erythrobacter sp. NE805 TaxID=3389875 RepID=UPI00396B3BF2
MADAPPTYRFEAFELDCANRQLRRAGEPVELGSRYFDALALLVARPGELVSKDAFMAEVWHGVPVTDEALTQCIRTLRRALGDAAGTPRFIQTVPKHGYRFIAPLASEPPRLRAEAAGEARRLPAQVAGTATLAGLAVGLLAGLVYGVLAGTGGGGQVLILAAMVGALGLLAGAGLGAGIAAALAWRGRANAAVVAGAMLGGLAVGALGNLLGREGVGLLSGLAIAGVTGPFEGLVLGTASGIAAQAALSGRRRGAVLGLALAAGALGGALIHLAGGTLLAGSLHALEQGLPGAQLRFDRLGPQGFTSGVRAFTAVVEGASFVGALAAGLLGLRRR